MRHERWINLCLKLAKKSQVVTFKHGAVLVSGGRIISLGINKLKTGKAIDPVYQSNSGESKGVHAECSAIYKLDASDLTDATMYIAGISKGGNYICSKPCEKCQDFLRRRGVRHIVYLDRHDIAELWLR